MDGCFPLFYLLTYLYMGKIAENFPHSIFSGKVTTLVMCHRQGKVEVHRPLVKNNERSVFDLMCLHVCLCVCGVGGEGAAVFFPNKEMRRRQLFQLIADMNVRTSDVINFSSLSVHCYM